MAKMSFHNFLGKYAKSSFLFYRKCMISGNRFVCRSLVRMWREVEVEK